jgi:pimeloyl-ACP methyl ester carboxylesterase
MNGLVLIHAFPLDASMWDPQVAAFEGRVAIATPNLPGFGGAEPAGDVMTMEMAAQRCLDAMDGAGLDLAVVCGLSMGGYVALELWRRAPQRFAGLVLANTRAGADSEEGASGRRALAERLGSEGNGFLVDKPPPLLTADASPELWARVKGIIAAQPVSAIAAASLGMAERPDSTGDLAGISVPTVVVTSSGDTLIPPDATSPMADQIPGATLRIIEGAGHLSNLQAPEAFNEVLSDALGRAGLA